MVNIAEKFPILTTDESMRTTDWAAGARAPTESTMWLLHDNALKQMTVICTPAWYKMVDEPIVNALDHAISCAHEKSPEKILIGAKSPVTEIHVDFMPNGRLRVTNNGPGIEILEHPDGPAKFNEPIYIPTLIFGVPFQGSNAKKDKAVGVKTITGGVNGIGAKICNIFSTEFALETVDGKNYFLQKWNDNMKVRNKPIIMPKSKAPKDRNHQHTTLSFMPDYVGSLGYTAPICEGHPDWETHKRIVHTRTWFAALYASYMSPQTKVYFNGELQRADITMIAQMVASTNENARVFYTKTVPGVNNYSWQVAAVVGIPGSISCVNGVVVPRGKHIKHLQTQIVDAARKNMNDKLGNSMGPTAITNSICVIINGVVPSPGWTGQRKDELDYEASKLKQTLNKEFITNVVSALTDLLAVNVKSQTTKKVEINTAKYVPAICAGTRKSAQCTLIFAEGDSAAAQVKTGITTHLSYDYYGVVSLGGVIVNARKEVEQIMAAGGTRYKMSKKLQDNEFFNTLCAITGLNINYTYDKAGPNYKKEMSALQYGRVVGCVDQDLDGKGNILGLILNMFHLFWPKLIEQGFVYWFSTPVIRAYPKVKSEKKVLSFHSTIEFENWQSKNDVSRYNIKYYKGLGSHDRDEAIHMFKDFPNKLMRYTLDDAASSKFEIYFGKNPDLRKQVLSIPVSEPSKELIARQYAEAAIACSDHLQYETEYYQRDNLERKLDSYIDGQNQSGRKILDGSIKVFATTNETKVANLAGSITSLTSYHHGEASLSDSIISRAFIACGGKQLPIFKPYGNTGTRLQGGDDAAAARYVKVGLNKPLVSLIFPSDDYHMLEFNFDDGMRNEPKYFVPIIPMAILESTELPAHGWKLKAWARDVKTVMTNVRRLITLGEDAQLIDMPPAQYAGIYRFKGTFRTIRGDLYSFGRYHLSGNILTITELPLRVWNNSWMSAMQKKMKNSPIIASIDDRSNDVDINIVVTLQDGAVEKLDNYADSIFADGVEEYFLLRERMDTHLNLMGANHEVVEFKGYFAYEQAMRRWFPIRRDLYTRRVERRKVMCKLRMRYYELILRYIETSNLKGRPLDEMTAWIEANGFPKVRKTLIFHPEFTPTEDIEKLSYDGDGCSYDYLLNLSDRDKSAESIRKMRNNLDELTEELKYLDGLPANKFLGESLWLEELDKLESVIEHGFATGWKYDDADRYEL